VTEKDVATAPERDYLAGRLSGAAVGQRNEWLAYQKDAMTEIDQIAQEKTP
jgi:hypothetical protein